jgi:hypothetical protein
VSTRLSALLLSILQSAPSFSKASDVKSSCRPGWRHAYMRFLHWQLSNDPHDVRGQPQYDVAYPLSALQLE